MYSFKYICHLYFKIIFNKHRQYLPVFCYVTPLNMIEVIPTHLHAARFVSLISIKTNNQLPGVEKIENWGRFHTILSAVFIII